MDRGVCSMTLLKQKRLPIETQYTMDVIRYNLSIRSF